MREEAEVGSRWSGWVARGGLGGAVRVGWCWVPAEDAGMAGAVGWFGVGWVSSVTGFFGRHWGPLAGAMGASREGTWDDDRTGPRAAVDQIRPPGRTGSDTEALRHESRRRQPEGLDRRSVAFGCTQHSWNGWCHSRSRFDPLGETTKG